MISEKMSTTFKFKQERTAMNMTKQTEKPLPPVQSADSTQSIKRSQASGIPTKATKIFTDKKLPPRPNADPVVHRMPLSLLNSNIKSPQIHSQTSTLTKNPTMKDQLVTMTRSKATLVTTSAPKTHASKVTVGATGSPARALQPPDLKSNSPNFSRPSPRAGQTVTLLQSAPRLIQGSPLTIATPLEASAAMQDFIFVDQPTVFQPLVSQPSVPQTVESQAPQTTEGWRPGYRMKRLSAVPRSSDRGPTLYISDEADLLLGPEAQDRHPESAKRSASADSFTAPPRKSSLLSLLPTTNNESTALIKWPIDTESPAYRMDHQRYLLKKSLEANKTACPVSPAQASTPPTFGPALPQLGGAGQLVDLRAALEGSAPAASEDKKLPNKIENSTSSTKSTQSSSTPSKSLSSEAAAEHALEAITKFGLIKQDSVTERSRPKNRLASNIRDFIRGPSKQRAAEKPTTVGEPLIGKAVIDKLATGKPHSEKPPTQSSKPAPVPRSSSPAIRMRSHRVRPGATVPSVSEPQRLKDLTATAVAMLEEAKHEPSASRKEKLISVSKLLLDAITSAQDVHKAMREAQQAAKEAEICYEMTELSVCELNKLAAKVCEDEKIEQIR